MISKVFSRAVLPVFTLTVLLLLPWPTPSETQFEHKHDPVLPTDKGLWDACCRNHDCVEATIHIKSIDKRWTEVAIANFPVLKVKRSRIYPSGNGKSYFCSFNRRIPPTDYSILCIFVVKPNYVLNTRRN